MMFRFFVAVVFVQGVAASCPDGWQRHGKTCYHISHDQEDWPGAFQMCKIMGGKLVEIETDIENNYIRDQTSHAAHPFWIGLSDVSEEGTWVWMTSMAPALYVRWAPNEPSITNSLQQEENCGVFYIVSGDWNDGLCSSLNYYICEKEETGDGGIVG